MAELRPRDNCKIKYVRIRTFSRMLVERQKDSEAAELNKISNESVMVQK